VRLHRIIGTGAVVTALCGATALPAVAQRPAPARVSLCEVVAAPLNYNYRAITLIAHYESDGPHGEALFDPSCNELRIRLQVRRDTKGYEKLVRVRQTGTVDKIVTGTFTGTFLFTPTAGHPPRVLTVSLIESINIRLKPEGSIGRSRNLR